MKLATSTGDFFGYTDSQIESLRLIYEAGFRYADYNFGCDYVPPITFHILTRWHVPPKRSESR